MFGAPGLVFGGTERVGSRFYVSRSRTHFGRYRGRRVLFSWFALPNSFSAVPRAWGPIFRFCAPELVFSGTNGDGSRFHILRSRTHFRRYRDRRVPFSCLAHPDKFSTVPRASSPISCLSLPNTFSAVSWASGPFFMLCAVELIFGGTEGVWFCFHVFLSRTRFRRYLGLRVPFSYSTLPDSFSAVLRASGVVFMICAPELVFGGTVGVDSRFHVLRSRTRFRRYRGCRV
jgi:hypothetical protein